MIITDNTIRCQLAYSDVIYLTPQSKEEYVWLRDNNYDWVAAGWNGSTFVIPAGFIAEELVMKCKNQFADIQDWRIQQGTLP